MEYYYTPKEYTSSKSLTVVDDEAKHLGRVLRKKTGQEIFVTDGEGNLFKTKITNISKEIIDCEVLEKYFRLNEPEIKITLYQSLIKNPDRFEFVIEKAVELGVSEIQPVITENVINKASNKSERWKSIAISAMKQSQRCWLPDLKEPAAFIDAITSAKSGIKLIADERNLNGYIDAKQVRFESDDKTIDIFIGPEGGFTKEEIGFAEGNNFKILNLGSRKYRSETAALLSIGLLLNI